MYAMSAFFANVPLGRVAPAGDFYLFPYVFNGGYVYPEIFLLRSEYKKGCISYGWMIIKKYSANSTCRNGESCS